MSVRKFHTIILLAGAGLLAGCAGDSAGLLTTGAVSNPQPTKTATKPNIDPVCITLASRINELQKEGTPDRIKEVAAGKTKTAVVKRSALAKLTELNAANTEFQQKCSTLTPAQRAALAAGQTATPAPASTTTSGAATTTATTSATANISTAQKAADNARAAATEAANAKKKLNDAKANANAAASTATTVTP